MQNRSTALAATTPVFVAHARSLSASLLSLLAVLREPFRGTRGIERIAHHQYPYIGL
jgi:hypothetical protein